MVPGFQQPSVLQASPECQFALPYQDFPPFTGVDDLLPALLFLNFQHRLVLLQCTKSSLDYSSFPST